MSANDNYPVQDFGNFLSPIEMEFSLKTAIFSDFFLWFLESTSNFKHFGKKKWSPYLLHFGNYRMWKTRLDHSLKNTVPEHPFTVNMLNSPKLLSNMHETTSIIFFHHSSAWFGKYLRSWYVKSYGCFLTHWLPMTIILFKIVRICRPGFKCKYL